MDLGAPPVLPVLRLPEPPLLPRPALEVLQATLPTYKPPVVPPNNSFKQIMEAAVSAVVAVIAGLAAITNRLHNRINQVHGRISDMDRRVDGVELRIATNYVDKDEFKVGLKRMEDHMVRIENKLDQIVMRNG